MARMGEILDWNVVDAIKAVAKKAMPAGSALPDLKDGEIHIFGQPTVAPGALKTLEGEPVSKPVKLNGSGKKVISQQWEAGMSNSIDLKPAQSKAEAVSELVKPEVIKTITYIDGPGGLPAAMPQKVAVSQPAKPELEAIPEPIKPEKKLPQRGDIFGNPEGKHLVVELVDKGKEGGEKIIAYSEESAPNIRKNQGTFSYKQPENFDVVLGMEGMKKIGRKKDPKYEKRIEKIIEIFDQKYTRVGEQLEEWSATLAEDAGQDLIMLYEELFERYAKIGNKWNELGDDVAEQGEQRIQLSDELRLLEEEMFVKGIMKQSEKNGNGNGENKRKGKRVRRVRRGAFDTEDAVRQAGDAYGKKVGDQGKNSRSSAREIGSGEEGGFVPGSPEEILSAFKGKVDERARSIEERIRKADKAETLNSFWTKEKLAVPLSERVFLEAEDVEFLGFASRIARENVAAATLFLAETNERLRATWHEQMMTLSPQYKEAVLSARVKELYDRMSSSGKIAVLADIADGGLAVALKFSQEHSMTRQAVIDFLGGIDEVVVNLVAPPVLEALSPEKWSDEEKKRFAADFAKGQVDSFVKGTEENK